MKQFQAIKLLHLDFLGKFYLGKNVPTFKALNNEYLEMHAAKWCKILLRDEYLKYQKDEYFKYLNFCAYYNMVTHSVLNKS